MVKDLSHLNIKEHQHTHYVVYPVPLLFTAAGMSQLFQPRCTSKAISPNVELFPSCMTSCLLKIGNLKWSCSRLQPHRCAGKTGSSAECCSGQADTHSPSQVLLCRTVKYKQRGAKQSRGWWRIREQTKQNAHGRSQKLAAKKLVNNPPVCVSLPPQKQDQIKSVRFSEHVGGDPDPTRGKRPERPPSCHACWSRLPTIMLQLVQTYLETQTRTSTIWGALRLHQSCRSLNPSGLIQP